MIQPSRKKLNATPTGKISNRPTSRRNKTLGQQDDKFDRPVNLYLPRLEVFKKKINPEEYFVDSNCYNNTPDTGLINELLIKEIENFVGKYDETTAKVKPKVSLAARRIETTREAILAQFLKMMNAGESE